MQSRPFFLAIAILMLSVTSCSTTYRVRQITSLDGYVGYSHNEIVESFGAPSSEVSDGGDGYILIYEGNKSIFSYAGNYVSAAGAAPTAQFYMTGDGECRRITTMNTGDVRAYSPGATVALIILLLLPIL